jgi:hypothetical protein
MAEHLAQRFGTEKDRVNCPFYIKIGCATIDECMVVCILCSCSHRVPVLSSLWIARASLSLFGFAGRADTAIGAVGTITGLI